MLNETFSVIFKHRAQYCIVLISVMFQRGIWQRNGTRTLLRWTASRWHFSQFRYSWKYHWSVSNMLLQFSYQLLRNDLSTYSKRVSESWNCQRTLQSLWQWNAGFKSWRRWSLQWTPKYVKKNAYLYFSKPFLVHCFFVKL